MLGSACTSAWSGLPQHTFPTAHMLPGYQLLQIKPASAPPCSQACPAAVPSVCQGEGHVRWVFGLHAERSHSNAFGMSMHAGMCMKACSVLVLEIEHARRMGGACRPYPLNVLRACVCIQTHFISSIGQSPLER